MEHDFSASPEGLVAAYRGAFRVGGVSVSIAGEKSGDASLVPALEPFRIADGASDIAIQVTWVARLSTFSQHERFDSGTTWRFYDRGDGFQFDFRAPVFGDQPYKRMLVDTRFRRVALQLSEESFRDFPGAVLPLDYPVDELLIMHRLTQEKAVELHGCGIVSADGVGNLFVGHSGAGKSTTTRLWTAREDVEILSDDRIIVRRNCDASAAEESCFAPDDKGKKPGEMMMYGTPWHGEAMFASPASAPLTRILVLEHGRGNVLTRLSQSQAVAELFARSFVPMHRHEYVESALEFLQQVAASVPCYRFDFEPHPGAVETILALRD